MTTHSLTSNSSLSGTFCGPVQAVLNTSILMGDVTIVCRSCAMPEVNSLVVVHAHYTDNAWHALSISPINAPSVAQPTQSETNKTLKADTPKTNKFSFARSNITNVEVKKTKPSEPREESRFSMPKRPTVPAAKHTPSKSLPSALLPSSLMSRQASEGASALNTTVKEKKGSGGFGKLSTPPKEIDANQHNTSSARGTLNARPREAVLKAWRLTNNTEPLIDIPY